MKVKFKHSLSLGLNVFNALYWQWDQWDGWGQWKAINSFHEASLRD